MADIEDERIFPDIEYLVHGNDQVHRTQSGAEMSSVPTDGSKYLLSYLSGKSIEFFYTVSTDICHFISFFI